MTLITDEKRSNFNSYASEFEKKYLLESSGQQHLAMYKRERDEVRIFWSEIKKAKQEGKPVTDMILEKLLPYSNTRHNRDKGYRISVAPAIDKDIKKWFENVGWHQPDDWDRVADAIYELVYDLIEKNDWYALSKFENNESISRGFKAGILTPTFYFLNPKYRIINNKTIDTINYLLDKNAISRDLLNYKQYLEIIENVVKDLDIQLFENADVFDMFCHWMCNKRLGGYARTEKVIDIIDNEETSNDEPQGHWEAIYYIVKTGNLLGYKTYVADPSKTAFDKKLSEIATLTDVPPIMKSAPEIHRIDVIWYKSTPPFFLFEVEDGGTMRDALHRLYNAMAFDARFFVISPIQNRSKFDKWVVTAPFKEFEERYNFRTYSDLFDFYKEAEQFTAMQKRFLSL